MQQSGHIIDVLHLDEEGFNPVMTAEDLKGFVECKALDPRVLEYQQRLKDADQLIFIFNMVKFVSDEKRRKWLTGIEKRFAGC